jgi:hypothetical protein
MRLYSGAMDNIVTLLEDRLAKAKAKVDRCSKALEQARTEMADVEAAMRVFANLQGDGASTPRALPSTVVAERQQNILTILRDVPPHEGDAPIELHAAYTMVFDDDVNIDTFRTTIWRMADKDFEFEGHQWRVMRVEGKYSRVRTLPV